MKLLIYGAHGWIGKQFVEILKSKNINYCEGESRVDDTDALEYEIKQKIPSHIVSFIGRTHGMIDNKQVFQQ